MQDPLPGQDFLNDQGDILIHIGTHQGIHLRHLPEQVFCVALYQAAGDNKIFTAAGLLVRRHLQNRIDGFFLGRFDKAAGIHNNEFRLGGVIGNFHLVSLNDAQHGLGIYQILGTTQTDKAYLHFFTSMVLSPKRIVLTQASAKVSTAWESL